MENDTQQNGTGLSEDIVSTVIDPTVTFESITFSDGTTISLESTEVVVLVGPNNAGKSAALRELEEHVKSSSRGIVLTNVKSCRIGTEEGLFEYLKRHTHETNNSQNKMYVGYRFSLSPEHIANYWSRNDGIYDLSKFFCMRLQTETRITDSNPAPRFRRHSDPSSHPIHLLYYDDKLELKISQYFQQAFGEELIVDRLPGSEFPLLVGQRLVPDKEQEEDRLSISFLDRLRDSTIRLEEQGDGMRSFASVILHLLAPITPSILILDEPEAFLHPPQAKLLGELIAKERSSRAQLFMATHSPDVLNGLLNVASDHLRVLRIRREGNINHVKELDKQRAKAISNDPLMKYSSVMAGVFHERVILCESDSDCMFYSALLDLPEINGGQQPDVFFTHANGKHRIATLAKALMELDVPMDVIADIDILKSDDVLQEIIETLGGDWNELQPIVQRVRNDIEQHKPWLNASEIKNGILDKLKSINSEGEFPRKTQKEIEKIFRKASPWDAVKEAGEFAIPSGDASNRFQELKAICKKVGLWIVHVGELEGFCKSVGGHGSRWVQQVLEERDLSTDAELKCARDFIHEIWTSNNSR